MDSMLMMSVREDFWGTSKTNNEVLWADVSRVHIDTKMLLPEEVTLRLEQLRNKSVLLLVHGFNDSKNAVIHDYFTIGNNAQQWIVDPLRETCLYDAILGFVWPGYNHFFDYFLAEKNSATDAPFLRKLLHLLSPIVNSLDVMAHSMGNLLLLEALDFVPKTNPIVNSIYSLAPAVGASAIDNQHLFFKSTTNAEDLSVFYSKKDFIEKWLFPIAEKKEALGHQGDIHPSKLPLNVQTLDCSAVVKTHSGYFDQEYIYKWICEKKNKQIPGPSIIQDMKLTSKGMWKVTRWREAVNPLTKV